MANNDVLFTPGEASPPSLAVPGLLELVWRRRNLVLLGLGGALLLALLYYLGTQPLYQATAQVLVVKKRPDAVTGVDTRQLSLEDYLATHQVLVRSTLIVERAIQKQHLEALPGLANLRDDLTETIIKGLIVPHTRPAGGDSDSILTLSFQGTQARECSVVLNAVIGSYQEFLEETYRDIRGETLRLITQARDLLHQELREKEVAYRRFRQATPPLLDKGKEGTSIRQERLSNIEARRSALLLRRAELQAQLAALENGQKDDHVGREALLAQVAAWTAQAEAARGAPSPQPQDKLFPLLLEEQKLRETLGDKHPEMQTLRRRIDVARNFVAGPSVAWRQAERTAQQETSRLDPVDLYRQYAEQELRHVALAEQLLAELYKNEHERDRERLAYEIEDEGFRTEIDRQQRLYDSIVKQLQHIDLIKDIGGYDARIISPPGVGKKIRPNAQLIFPAAAFVGALGGLGLALLAEMRGKLHATSEERGTENRDRHHYAIRNGR